MLNLRSTWCFVCVCFILGGRVDNTERKCIIHQSTNNFEEGPLVSPQTYASWSTLVKAAQVSSHTPILQLTKDLGENETPQTYYHRKCRSLFTMKTDITALKRKAEDKLGDVTKESGSNTKKPLRRSSIEMPESRVYKLVCIFCEKAKYIKCSKTKEKLMKATLLSKH